jgi:hypothetical protein
MLIGKTELRQNKRDCVMIVETKREREKHRYIVLAAQLGGARQVALVGDNDAGLTLDRLDHEAGHVRVGLQRSLQGRCRKENKSNHKNQFIYLRPSILETEIKLQQV